MKRTRLNPTSVKTRRLIQAAEQERREYAIEAGLCQCCRRKPVVDIHEIARGSHRQKAFVERCCWLALCRKCHELMDDYSRWPIAKQLVLKALFDADHFDRRRVNEIRGRAPEAINEIDAIRAAWEWGREQ
jgi:hypothetical protein